MKKLLFWGALMIAPFSYSQTPDSLAIIQQQNIEQQNQAVEQQMNYDRSSLAVAMVFHSEDEFGQDIHTAFGNMPFPDKYDNHDVGIKVINNDLIPSPRYKGKKGLIKAEYGKRLNIYDVEANAATLEKLLNEAHVANYLIAKWFGLYESQVCNVELIKQRGQYNATDLDVAIASQSARGLAMLSDAGEMLIGNTYMLVNDMTYVMAEEKAEVAKGILSVLGAIVDVALDTDLGSNLSSLGGQVADSFTGFNVKTHSYLFRLQWNDDIAATFYNEYYFTEPNPEKVKKFLSDDRFTIKYVAHEFEKSGMNADKATTDRHELIKLVCKRSMDKNIAALQLQYEDFKVKTPIHEIIYNVKGNAEGYAVKIGLKEGINEKSTFQVIRKEIDPKTNRTTYKYVASMKPVRGKIWDNRYMAAEQNEVGSNLKYTTLQKTSGGEILPGMLVIEGRYSKIKEDNVKTTKSAPTKKSVKNKRNK